MSMELPGILSGPECGFISPCLLRQCAESRGISPTGFKNKHSGKYPARECLGACPL